jgi:hypothetical protein
VAGQPSAQDATSRWRRVRLSAAMNGLVEALTPLTVVLQLLTVCSTAVGGLDPVRHSHWRTAWSLDTAVVLIFLPSALLFFSVIIYYRNSERLNRYQIWFIITSSVAGAATNIILLISIHNGGAPVVLVSAVALASCMIVIMRFARWWLGLAFLELVTAALGTWAGGLDAISAPWLTAKILGIVMFLLGVLVAVGVIIFFKYFYSLTDNKKRLILAGSVAGVVIDIVLILDTLHYSTARLALFGFGLVPCLICACRFCRSALVRPYLKAATAAAIGSTFVSIAPFLYNSVYLPSTADVPVQLSFDSATSSQPRPGFYLLDVKISLEDMASTRAVVLTSMISVYGISYSAMKANQSQQPSQDQADNIGVGSTVPNLELSGRPSTTLITLAHAINNGSYLPANIPFTRSMPVLVPAGKYQELDVEVMLRYARSDRLTLTSTYFGPKLQRIPGCSHDARTAWHIAQSTLGRLTHGQETAVADWCANVTSPQIFSFIGGPPGRSTSNHIVKLEDAAYQVTRESEARDRQVGVMWQGVSTYA